MGNRPGKQTALKNSALTGWEAGDVTMETGSARSLPSGSRGWSTWNRTGFGSGPTHPPLIDVGSNRLRFLNFGFLVCKMGAEGRQVTGLKIQRDNLAQGLSPKSGTKWISNRCYLLPISVTRRTWFWKG